MIHVLNGLPVEYKVQVSKLEECFGSASNPLTIQDMCTELSLKFAWLKRQAAEQSETDQALAAFHIQGEAHELRKIWAQINQVPFQAQKQQGRRGGIQKE